MGGTRARASAHRCQSCISIGARRPVAPDPPPIPRRPRANQAMNFYHLHAPVAVASFCCSPKMPCLLGGRRRHFCPGPVRRGGAVALVATPPSPPPPPLPPHHPPPRRPSRPVFLSARAAASDPRALWQIHAGSAQRLRTRVGGLAVTEGPLALKLRAIILTYCLQCFSLAPRAGHGEGPGPACVRQRRALSSVSRCRGVLLRKAPPPLRGQGPFFFSHR